MQYNMITQGAKGDSVKLMQGALISAGYSVSLDGDFGPKTKEVLIKFQLDNNLQPTGIYDSVTESVLKTYGSDALSCAIPMYLNPSQYCNSESKKIGVCLHHTAGGPRAEDVVRVWNQDDRGRVATHFIIGADGKIVQSIPLKGWGYHIAMSRMGFEATLNDRVNSGYIGIEICNWGMLSEKNGQFFNYVGGLVPKEEVVTLDKPFRTYPYWHKYTDAQVKAVNQLLVALKNKFGFQYETDIPHDNSWFELSWDAMACKRVLTTHTNFEYGKFDCSPQENFFKMITF